MSDSSIFRKEALERLSSPEQLDQLMQIVSARSWLPLASLGGVLFVGILWGFLGRIPVTTTGEGFLVYANSTSDELVGVTYFDAGEISQIQPGMAVLLIPDVDRAQESGGLLGRVESVSAPQLTTVEAVRGTDPDQNRVIEVLVSLTRDPEMPSGYQWSAGGYKMTPAVGMPAIARVTLDEKAPIAFVLPFLDPQ